MPCTEQPVAGNRSPRVGRPHGRIDFEFQSLRTREEDPNETPPGQGFGMDKRFGYMLLLFFFGSIGAMILAVLLFEGP